MNTIATSILSRRSIRTYRNLQVEDDKLQLVLEAARSAPSGMNEQPWHFTVLQDKAKLKQLDTLVAGEGDTFFYHAPTLILVSIEIGNPFTQADTACAMTNMMQMAHALDLGSVWCNRINGNAAFDTHLEAFGVPEGYRVTATLALGYAAEDPSEKPLRKQSITYIR